MVSSAGSVRDQIIRVRLFVRCGIIGLTLDDVSGVRAPEHEGRIGRTMPLLIYTSKNTAERAAIPIVVAEHRRCPWVQCVETLLMLSKLKGLAMNGLMHSSKVGMVSNSLFSRATNLRAYHCGGISARLVRTLEPLYLPPQSRSTFRERNICQGFLHCCNIRQRARRYC